MAAVTLASALVVAVVLALALGLPSPAAGQSPELTIEKSTNGSDADTAPGPTLAAGDPVAWTYEVVVNGPVPLYDLVVSDSSGVVPSCDIDNDGTVDGSHVHPGPLDAGQSFLCTASGTAHAEGIFVSTARVQGSNFEGTARYEDTDASHYTVPSAFVIDPEVAIETLVNGLEADGGDGPFVQAGQPVTWTFVVTNLGNVALADLEVTNSLGLPVDCNGAGAVIAGPIPPGGSASCTASSPAAAAGTGVQAVTGSVFGAALDPSSGAPVAQADANDPAVYTPVELPAALAFTGPTEVFTLVGASLTAVGALLWLAGRRLDRMPIPLPTRTGNRTDRRRRSDGG